MNTTGLSTSWARILRAARSRRRTSRRPAYRLRLEALEERLTPTTLPPGFVQTQVVSGLNAGTAMAFAPDGRLFVLEQGGNVKLVRSDGTTWTALHLNVDSAGEHGLLGIAFDPAFNVNHFVYVYYTNPAPGASAWSTGEHNQLSRFTVDDSNPQQPEFIAEAPILDWNTLTATIHNGGAIHFGLDGMLYADAGDNAQTFTQGGQTYRVSQSLSNLLGKQLRIDVANFNSGLATRDDTTVGHLIPPDNPFVGTATGINQLIYALGLRNPFTFAVQPGTGKIFINDVGESTWEEIDQSVAGANFGWSGGNTDGFGQTPPGPGTYHDPLLAYNHTGGPAGGGSAIVGGAFYDPANAQFPSSYVGKYFYEDLEDGWIRVFDPSKPGSASNPDTSTAFATGLPSGLHDLEVDSQGNLYCLAGAGSVIIKISYALSPAIITQPANQSVLPGQSAKFTVIASGPSLSYQWQHLVGATWTDVGVSSASLTIKNVGASDAGGYRVVIRNTSSSDISNTATLTVLGRISINDVSVMEGNSGQTNATFTVSLAGASQPVTVHFATADGTATLANNDYQATNGDLLFNPGETTKTITVPVNGDTTPEPDETFTVNLTNATNAVLTRGQAIGTILNDDASLSIAGATRPVGTIGTVPFFFTVTLPFVDHLPVTVDYATSDGTATVAHGDYQAASGDLTLSPGQTTKSAIVLVNGNTTPGPDETFVVTLSNPSNAALTRGQATGVIEFQRPTLSFYADYDGDGKSDTAVFGPYGPGGTGRFAVLTSGGGGFSIQFGGTLDQPVVGDFDGDGKTDVGVAGPYGPAGAIRFAIRLSGGGTIVQTLGGPLDKPVIGDFDGDHKADLGVYGPYGPGGVNRLLVMESGGGVINMPLGGPLDTFVAGDFDGDGKTDFAVYGPDGPGGTNRLNVLESGGGSFSTLFGGPLDRPLVGDFDGDGKTDIAVYGPYGPKGTGRFAILLSAGGAILQPFGGSLDRAVAGDFDGDGKTDLAVCGPYGPGGTGRLAALLSGGGSISSPFGGPQDSFLPSPPAAPAAATVSGKDARLAGPVGPNVTAFVVIAAEPAATASMPTDSLELDFARQGQRTHDQAIEALQKL